MSIKVVDFGGKLTPEQLLLRCMEHASRAKILCVVMLDEDDYILTGASDGSALKKLGLLDVFKDRLMETMDDNDEYAATTGS